MTEQPKDGGPAFPHEPRGPAYGRRYDGMTLRDWFAGQALAGLCSNPDWSKQGWGGRAEYAYKAADAMLAARVQA